MYNRPMPKERPAGEQPLIPFAGCVAGEYLYRDAFEGAPAQRVRLDYELGDCIVTFLDAEPEDGEVRLMKRDMAGDFDGPIR
jgi:hypothetical protein